MEGFEKGDYIISANVVDKKLKKHWTFANVYGPAQDDCKERFMYKLSSFCFKAKYPLLIGGDFNILRYSSEKIKKIVENNFSKIFNLIINTYELKELSLSGGKFTWSNNRKNPTLLDRVLMSTNWELEFPMSTLTKIPRYSQITIL